MSSCIIPTAAASASPVVAESPTTSATTTFSLRRLHSLSLSSLPNVRLFTKTTWPSMRSSMTGAVGVRAHLNDASMGGSSTGAVSNSEATTQEIKNGKPSSESVSRPLASDESISEFITQVASLVKLVDSRDIVELKMKQLDCEVLIRKKEALIQASPPPVMMQSPAQQAPSTPFVSAPVAASSAAPPAAPAVPSPPKSSAPTLKSPMAGTFYRSPAPSAPPFIKVGDKVQKGQVLCIIEAMKLMNEIEADQSGTIVKIIAEDGKPVSLDSPLFAIQP